MGRLIDVAVGLDDHEEFEDGKTATYECCLFCALCYGFILASLYQRLFQGFC